MDLDNPSYFSISSGKAEFSRNSDVTGERSPLRQPAPPQTKTTLRTFGRFLSANVAENRLLIKGEPRLSDLAPEVAAKHAKRCGVSRDGIVYAALATNSDDSNNSEDEVFIEDGNSARYYNWSGPRVAEVAERRHSIGTTFENRERTTSVSSSIKSFKEDIPINLRNEEALIPEVIDDHALRHASFPRKRCTKCATRGESKIKRADMDDILIVSLRESAAATLWVEYFTSYFRQVEKQTNRKAFKISHLKTEDFFEGNDEQKLNLDKSASVKLQLVIICPAFLNYITTHKCSENFQKLFLPDRTLALLLAISDNDITETHKKAMPTYFKWKRMSVGQDQDEHFTKEFVSNAMVILARVWKQQSIQAAQDKACFSVSPKKIRHGHNNIFILLSYPLTKDDIVKISIEQSNELYELRSIKRRNPYTLKVTVPDNFTEITAIVNVLVEKNGNIIGSRPLKCESRLHELEQVLKCVNHPVEFMCQTLGFSPADKENLDNWMVQNFQKNLPMHFNLLASHSSLFTSAIQIHKHSYEEYPTLLHFATKFGLEKLAMQLLDCPGADVAYEIRNIFEMTPAEIAEANNHIELAASLRNYMNMHEFSNMYAKFKAISSFHEDINSKNIIDEDHEYVVPKNNSECYKICPPPRPINLSLHRSQSPTSTFSSPTRLDPDSPSGYMHMHPPFASPVSAKTPLQDCPKQKFEPKCINEINFHLPDPTTDLKSIHEKEKPMSSSIIPIKEFANVHHPATSPMEFHEDKVQKELVEIINDFKNNIHSISQVEKLVEEWKNRNDVQKSFKEKQEQLKEMRLRYEKIQEEMKQGLKKSSPFDRIKKLFTRSKFREEHHEISRPTITNSTSTLNLPTGQQRPVSSLSTSSSGSSGRMSTISGCSVGDSGTHSDNEERKNILLFHSDDVFRNELSKVIMGLNYSTVPTPKPFKPSIKQKLTTTVEVESNPLTSSTSNTDQYYTECRPTRLYTPDCSTIANTPSSQMNSPMNEYINLNPAEQGFQSDSLGSPHEYINYQPPS